MKKANRVNIGMIGGGTVGSGVFHALQKNAALMASRLGVTVSIVKVAVKAFDEPRPYPIPSSVMTLNWQEVVNDPDPTVHTILQGATSFGQNYKLLVAPLATYAIRGNIWFEPVTVWVDGRVNHREVAISVRDRGIGIEPREQREIFQKFVRGAAAKKAGIKGTGIGRFCCEV